MSYTIRDYKTQTVIVGNLDFDSAMRHLDNALRSWPEPQAVASLSPEDIIMVSRQHPMMGVDFPELGITVKFDGN